MYKTHPSLLGSFLLIPTPFLVKYLVPPVIKRRFKPGVRRGKDKSLTKFYKVKPVYVPSKDVLVDAANGVVYCHTAYYSTLLHDLSRFTTEVSVGGMGTPANRVTGWRDAVREDLLSLPIINEWKMTVKSRWI